MFYAFAVELMRPDDLCVLRIRFNHASWRATPVGRREVVAEDGVAAVHVALELAPQHVAERVVADDPTVAATAPISTAIAGPSVLVWQLVEVEQFLADSRS